jgi:hypothetical protein
MPRFSSHQSEQSMADLGNRRNRRKSLRRMKSRRRRKGPHLQIRLKVATLLKMKFQAQNIVGCHSETTRVTRLTV